MLCQRSKELSDIDEQIQATHVFFMGKLYHIMKKKKSVDKTGEAKDDGVWTEILAYGHIPEIVTDTGKEYKELYIFCCAVDEKEPELVGVYAMIIESADGTEFSIKLLKE